MPQHSTYISYKEAKQLWTIIWNNNFLAGKLGSVTKALIGELFTVSSVSHKSKWWFFFFFFLTSGLWSCWYQLSLGSNILELESSVKPEFDEEAA